MNYYDDWGWYIDTENMTPITNININTNSYININIDNNNNIKNRYLNNCDIDDYEYYFNINDDDDDNFDNVNQKMETKYYKPKFNKFKLNKMVKLIFGISSTTMITGIITYIIFFML
jgi:hypothetical protein